MNKQNFYYKTKQLDIYSNKSTFDAFALYSTFISKIFKVFLSEENNID